jgi:hypothetical protein
MRVNLTLLSDIQLTLLVAVKSLKQNPCSLQKQQSSYPDYQTDKPTMEVLKNMGKITPRKSKGER